MTLVVAVVNTKWNKIFEKNEQNSMKLLELIVDPKWQNSGDSLFGRICKYVHILYYDLK